MRLTGDALALPACRKALGALCVGLFITLLDQSLVAVALPQITEDLDATVNQAVWVSAIYLLTFAVPLQSPVDSGDRFGQRNVYVVGMAIFTVAAATCAFAPTIELLIVARAVQGFGASLLNPQPLSVINQILPGNQTRCGDGRMVGRSWPAPLDFSVRLSAACW